MAELRNKVNARSASTPITDELHTIGEDTANVVYLDEAPEIGAAIAVNVAGGGAAYTQIHSGTPAAGEFRADEEVGRILFNSADDGDPVEIDYTAVGAVLSARDINRIHARLDASEAVGGMFAAEQVVTAAANVELDPRSEQSVYIEVDTAMQLDDFSDMPAGAAGLIVLEQDSGGGNAVTFDTAWRQIGSGSVETTGSKITLVNWYIRGAEILYTLVPEA